MDGDALPLIFLSCPGRNFMILLEALFLCSPDPALNSMIAPDIFIIALIANDNSFIAALGLVLAYLLSRHTRNSKLH